jgi:hypothetical protein
MAVIISENDVTVFKFPEAGLVELCSEVVDFVRSRQHVKYNVDINKAYYSSDNEHGYLQVVFPKKRNVQHVDSEATVVRKEIGSS